MSNTWDYKFAFRIEGREDVPPEFRSPYDRLVRAKGLPVFGLFTPALEEHAFLVSHWHPPRLVLVFPQAFDLLSLDTHSHAVGTFELSRSNFLGYGFAEFLLSCWFTVYHGYAEGGKMVVRLPSRAGEHYWELSRVLLGWCGGECHAIRNAPQHSVEMAGFPPKFSSFLKTHPELGTTSEFFFQPAMEPRGKRGGAFANLLLSKVSKGIVVLSDQSRHHRSEAGIEMTFLPIRRVQSAGWIEPSQNGGALLRIDLHGKESHSQINWPIFAGLRPYAFHWIRALNDAANAARQQEQQTPEDGPTIIASRGNAIPIS